MYWRCWDGGRLKRSSVVGIQAWIEAVGNGVIVVQNIVEVVDG